MIYTAIIPGKNTKQEAYASRISEAAVIFAQSAFGKGWGQIKVFEAPDSKSAIVVAPNHRPFRIDSYQATKH